MKSSRKKLIRNSIVGAAIVVCILMIGFQIFACFNPYIRLAGTWHGDGTLDLLGNSPFDHALELTFHFDRTGRVVTEQGETTFTYDVHKHHRDIVILDAGNGYHHGQQFVLEGDTFSIIRDDGIVKFTRGR